MACHLVGAKPLSETMLLIGPLGTKVNEILIEIPTLAFRKNTFKNVLRKILSRPQCFTCHHVCQCCADL